jgi:Na+-driven multidrug efflux pump
MLMNLAGHWAVGLPLGYAACFWWGWGVRGLWIGLGAGLTLVGSALLFVWADRERQWPGPPIQAGAGVASAAPDA